ncbi:MAG: hypothetical protein ACYDAY_04420 [Candidatus Dormibacteria bacterium]
MRNKVASGLCLVVGSALFAAVPASAARAQAAPGFKFTFYDRQGLHHVLVAAASGPSGGPHYWLFPGTDDNACADQLQGAPDSLSASATGAGSVAISGLPWGDLQATVSSSGLAGGSFIQSPSCTTADAVNAGPPAHAAWDLTDSLGDIIDTDAAANAGMVVAASNP